MAEPFDIGDFARFFEAVRGRPPFPWQERLARTVVEDGRWPALLDLPTGSGKTAVLDIATFLIALGAGSAVARHPRRVVLVVDRRVVVDQAAVAAAGLAAALRNAADPLVGAVADALRSLSGTDEPLATATLRGAIVRDERWARRPDVPALLAATVDQVGSRLLFRGYGLSSAMRPIHAGLFGCDTLILLDEVHLSQPFGETLRTIGSRHRAAEEALLPGRWQVVEMSATPATPSPGAFRLEPGDLDPSSSPVLHRRLAASKPVELRTVPGRDRSTLARACATGAAELMAGGGHTVGVIVNRVDTAHLVLGELRARHGLDGLLLTGRMRPFDRDELLRRHEERLRTGRDPRNEGEPLAVVATQCIEAGADFDLDGLVTECASLDALRQRFGRLDRDGVLSAGGAPARGIVLALAADVAADAEDPVYGPALAATWRWLSAVPGIDLGVLRFDLPTPGDLESLLAPREHAPILFPAHLDAWTQTWPRSSPDPDVALWLHGMRPPSADVHVVWRADLDAELIAEEPEAATSLVEACPPASGEAVTIPIAAARRWLAGGHAVPVADVDGVAIADGEQASGAGDRAFVRWRGGEAAALGTAGDLAPGDVVVVPSTYGGLADGSWRPEASDETADLGHLGQLGRRRTVLRLIPLLCAPAPVPDIGDDEADPAEMVWGWLDAHAEAIEDAGTRAAADRLRRHGRRGALVREMAGGGGNRYVVCSAFLASGTPGSLDGEETTEPAASPFAGPRQVALDTHLRGVAEIAASIARHCDLPPPLVDDLRLAAELHDVGKIDPRFQRWLRDGDELAAALEETALAKSALPRADRERRRRARLASGYPDDARHELLSVALVEGREDILARASDPELVLHLIASHHGFARPFVPVATDRHPVFVSARALGRELHGSTDHGLERLDSGVSERFWRSVDRYGRYGLAWLEAILRLADHRQSEREQTEDLA